MNKNRRLVDLDKLSDAIFVLTDKNGDTKSFTRDELFLKLLDDDVKMVPDSKSDALSFASVSRRINGLLKRKSDTSLNARDNEMVINCLERFDGHYPNRFFSKIGYYLEELLKKEGLSLEARRVVECFTKMNPKLTDKPPVYSTRIVDERGIQNVARKP
jgi:hypothetical protein